MRERFIALAGCYEDVAAMVEINPSEGCVSVNLLKSSRKLFHNASAGGGGGAISFTRSALFEIIAPETRHRLA